MHRCASCSRSSTSSLLLALGGCGSLTLCRGGLCGSLEDLGSNLSGSSGASLAEDHHLEALKVIEVGAGLVTSDLACLGQSSPLLVQAESLRLLNDISVPLATLQVKSELCQLESLQGVNHSFEVWSVNEHAVLVGDIGDDHLLAVVFSVVDERNTAALNEMAINWLHSIS